MVVNSVENLRDSKKHNRDRHLHTWRQDPDIGRVSMTLGANVRPWSQGMWTAEGGLDHVLGNT